ncbi:hypothetical protein G9A89_002344 [Geosiphon pyriformis]|nr:hypothetical protein G9A89_002344 [Geosiphon pyriformis]
MEPTIAKIVSANSLLAAAEKKSSNFISITKGQVEFFAQMAKHAKAFYCVRSQTDDYVLGGDADPLGGYFVFSGNEENLSKDIQDSTMINYPGLPGAKVHKGWYTLFEKWWSKHRNNFERIKVTEKYEYEITISGYSLGGEFENLLSVYAQLAALSINHVNSNIRITVYAFGAPRIGNEAFSKALFSAGRILRFTYINDPIPRLPVKDANEKYVHSGVEVWIEKPGAYGVFCATDQGAFSRENLECINRSTKKTPKDHSGPYYGVLMRCDHQ